MIAFIRKLLSLYALLLLVDFALPYLTDAQRPWMNMVKRICEPGERIGNRVAARLIPNAKIKLDIGPLAAVVLCLALRVVLSLFM